MQKIFDDYKRPLTICAGLIFFLMIGAVTMLFTEKEKSVPPISTEKISVGKSPREVSQANQERGVFVYVTGAVIRPGVYEVSKDARIFHAINAAGGLAARADDTALNLAGTLADGEHIHIPAKISVSEQKANTTQQSAQIAKIPSAPQKISNGQVDINHASAKELEQLVGVGPAISKRIVDYRNKHGAFTKPEDLLRVKGIGEVKLQKMRGQILIR